MPSLQVGTLDGFVQVAQRGIYMGDGAKRQRLTIPTYEKQNRAPKDLGDVFAAWKPMPDSGSFDPVGAENQDVEGSNGARGDGGGEAGSTKRKQSEHTINPMAQWRPLMATFLDEVLRHEGLGARASKCALCRAEMSASDPSSVRLFRCQQCGVFLQCQHCCRNRHQLMPLHTIEEWNGRYWLRQTLARIGLVYQLGHGGFPCPLPHPTVYEMAVLDVPYVHTVHLRYCSCNPDADDERYHQLLRNQWYPATVAAPSTCATFRTLQSYRLLNVVGNLNVTDFVTALERMTDTISFSGLTSLQVRDIFLPANYMFKCHTRIAIDNSSVCLDNGRSLFASNGPVALTFPGTFKRRHWALARFAAGHVLMKNETSPPDWRQADPKHRFLYMLILAVDANFRLKNRIRANEVSDTPLGSGWAYWVEPKAYNDHVKNYVSETDMSTCIAFAALLQKNTRMTAGLRVSGVGGCVCARHEIVRPNGLGDLQKGERYSNMDWIVFSALMGVLLLLVTISYDIACQWKKNIASRMRALPESMQKDLTQTTVQFGLPVFHADCHEEDCRCENKLSLQSGVGGTDGEGVERVWSGLNPAAFSTKEMSLSNRADALDDRIDNHNHLKNLGLGNLLQRRLVLALNERRRQIDAFEAVSEGLHSDTIKQWKRALREWEQDHTKPNPFRLKTSPYRSEAEIRLELQREEREHHTMAGAPLAGASATSFLAAGLQIEDIQSRIVEEAAKPGLLSTSQQAQVEEWRLMVLRKLGRFRELQAIYMPGAAARLAADEEARDVNIPPPAPEETALYMPSAMDLDNATAAPVGCRPGLAKSEESVFASPPAKTQSLRSGPLFSRSAGSLRTATPTPLGKNKRPNLPTSSKPWARVLIVQRGAINAATRPSLPLVFSASTLIFIYSGTRTYSMPSERVMVHVRSALVHRASRDASCRGFGPRGHRSTKETPKNSYRIVRALHHLVSYRLMSIAIRVDWTRALARKNRWCEEVLLLQEEMRRVLRYLRWQANWWIAHGPVRRPAVCPEVAQGLDAYAARQAAFCELLLGHLQTKWALEASRTLEEMRSLDGMAELEAACEAEPQLVVVR
ncbi:CxC2 domain-containing protein [Mycena kentingensis (nom. inval.)]|nr:CxC2 domain-containing protein [Mycena kentingensis (nom. inval.)]